MRSFQIRARGQSALFAGGVLALFIPFYALAVLLPSGYAQAQASSHSGNYAPLLQWTNGHVGLAIAYSLIEALPLVSILVLPYTLRRVVQGEGGRIAQWIGIAGLAIVAFMILLNLALLLSAAQQYAHAASASASAAIGANFRIVAVNESLIADILGDGLLAVWLWMVSWPLARLPGLERAVGFVGLAGAALFGASGLLVAFDPQQTYQTVVGTASGWFGLWLALVGVLLIQRAPLLGDDAPSPEEAPPEPSVTAADQPKDTASTTL